MRRPPPLHHRLRQPVVWLLVLAIVAYGHTATVVHLLGTAHRHEAPPTAAAFSARVQGAIEAILAWRAELRTHLHAPLRGGEGRAHADDSAATAHAAHFHTGFERHHHHGHEPSVVSLDAAGAGGDTADAAGPAGASSAAAAWPPLALAPHAPWAVAPAPGGAWPQTPADRWADAQPRHPERPPRA